MTSHQVIINLLIMLMHTVIIQITDHEQTECTITVAVIDI